MKRSEALELIRKKLEGQKIEEDFAEQILNVVEEIGMIPPPVMSGGEEPNQPYFTNDWEPEETFMGIEIKVDPNLKEDEYKIVDSNSETFRKAAAEVMRTHANVFKRLKDSGD